MPKLNLATSSTTFMSEFKWNCHHCQQSFKCNETLRGKQIVCPSCKHILTVPSAPGQPTASNLNPEPGKGFVPVKKAGGLRIINPSGETAKTDKPKE